MTAHEQQGERVVPLRPDVRIRRRHERPLGPQRGRNRVLAAASGQLAAQVVGEAPQGDVIEPAAWVGGNALGGPLGRRSDQCFLYRVIRGGEVSVTARDGAEHLRGKLAQQVPDGRVQGLRRHTSTGGAVMTWRTSNGMISGLPPGPGAAEALAAIS